MGAPSPPPAPASVQALHPEERQGEGGRWCPRPHRPVPSTLNGAGSRPEPPADCWGGGPSWPPAGPPAPGWLLGFRGEGEEHPHSLGSRAEPREVTPFLNEIELPFSSSSQMSAALDQIRS